MNNKESIKDKAKVVELLQNAGITNLDELADYIVNKANQAEANPDRRPVVDDFIVTIIS